MFNCKNLHHKCKAECCKTFPIPKDLYLANQDKIVNQPHKTTLFPGNKSEDAIFAETHNMNCVFLNKDLSCNIYENRPDICRLFGGESHPQLCCSWQDKQGNIRTRQNKRLIERNQYKNTLQLEKMFRIL